MKEIKTEGANWDKLRYGTGIEYKGKHIPIKEVNFSYNTEEEFKKHIEEIYNRLYNIN